jgi:spermidine/putrescine transport system permease protein
VNGRTRAHSGELAATAPSFLWLAVFFVAPTLLVFAVALRPADPYGGIGAGWTLESLRGLANPHYPAILWRTVWVSVAATVLCVLLAIPTAYAMARAPERWRRTILLLVVIPFWTSFLVRVFAWKSLLHPDGAAKQLLVALGLVAPETTLLYNVGAVLLVTVHTDLPFAILPIYAAAEKFDQRLLEAARDLGAGSWHAFRRVFLPGISRGIQNAVLMVLIPVLGSYVIPDIVGGPSGEMLGGTIAQRVFVDRNLPHAAGLAAILTLAVLLPLAGVFWLQGRRGGAPRLEELP